MTVFDDDNSAADAVADNILYGLGHQRRGLAGADDQNPVEAIKIGLVALVFKGHGQPASIHLHMGSYHFIGMDTIERGAEDRFELTEFGH